MAFDLENAVQQGFNRDVDTNDWHVEAHDLEVKLGDHGGAQEFRILDDDNVGVVVADSDGYLSIAGNMEVHSGHILLSGLDQINQEFVTMATDTDEVSVYVFDQNPDNSISGEKGSFGSSLDDGYMYINTDGALKWERLAMVSQIPNLEANLVTLQEAYDNDDDGGGATITTNATDGNIIFTGTEDFVVTTTDVDFDVTGAISLDADAASNLTVDSATLTLSTTTSGDVQVEVPAGGGDFIVDDASGSRYIRAITSNGELQLGDPDVFTTVMDNMRVIGDLIVEGTTTTISTQELLVEDRLIRLNAGSPDSAFSGNVGIEAEVGSDGYVEFHWDDTQSRWELSIDRSLAPEAQTFRPLAYLADSPGTLDLSSIGTDGFPTAGPNPDAGASVINTNDSNFPNTFGPLMTDDSVQAALEAIDAYFTGFADSVVEDATNTVTLQIAYDNDVDGGDATITTDATDGAVVIAGTEKLQVTATGGIDLDTDFDQDGATFNSSLSGAFDVTAGAASDITTTSGTLSFDGAGGIVLDGNGSNVIPEDNDTDSLGNGTTGWTDLYLVSNTDSVVIGLQDAGGTTIHNSTAGAELVGTHSDVFYQTFGPDMTDNTVQSALEAIDGYLQEITQGQGADTTLQQAYDNDVDGGDATITTNAADGNLVFAGTEDFNVTLTDVDFDVTGAISFDSDAASNFTTSAGALTLDGAAGVVLDGNGSNVIPADDDTDSLGDATHGWTDVFLRNVQDDATVGLGDAGTLSELQNTTSGASAIGTSDLNFPCFGPDMTDNTVQAALEAIDAYMCEIADRTLDDLDTTFSKCVGLDINGSVLNGNVKISTDGTMPSLDMKDNKTARSMWTIPVPTDWDGVSDIDVEVIWSPDSTDGGNVAWRLEYLGRSITELVDAAVTTSDLTNPASGTANALQSTEDNLSIAAGDIAAADDAILVSIVRRGTAGADTYNGDAQIHLVKYCYTAENIVT